MCLNIKENVNEQCTGQSPTVILHDPTRTLQSCTTSRFPKYTCTSTNPEKSCTGHLRQWAYPPVQLYCPKSATELGALSVPLPGWLQDSAKAVSYLIAKGNFAPLQEATIPLVFLFPASLAPSCILTFLLSLSHHFFVTNCLCLAVTIRIFLSALEFHKTKD